MGVPALTVAGLKALPRMRETFSPAVSSPSHETALSSPSMCSASCLPP